MLTGRFGESLKNGIQFHSFSLKFGCIRQYSRGCRWQIGIGSDEMATEWEDGGYVVLCVDRFRKEGLPSCLVLMIRVVRLEMHIQESLYLVLCSCPSKTCTRLPTNTISSEVDDRANHSISMEPGIPNDVRRPAQSKRAKGIPMIKRGASQDFGCCGSQVMIK
jgi:hypothetical protein